MKELILSDAELCALVSPAIRQRLKQAGFHTGTASDSHTGFFLPVNLDLVGTVSVERDDQGMWTFRQELNVELAERTADAHGSHVSAVGGLLATLGG